MPHNINRAASPQSWFFKGLVVALLGTVLGVSACKDTAPEPAPTCDGGALTCDEPSVCNVGDVCVNNCCTAFTGCSPGSCATGEFCDEDFTCKTIAAKCEFEGCSCKIVNQAGQLEATGTPTLTVANNSRDVSAILFVDGGSPLPGASFVFSVPTNSAATVTEAGTLTGTATAGTTTLTANASGVECTANVRNLGAVPADSLRFFVYDDLTGSPVAGAQVVVDQDGDGTPEGTLDTNADGVAVYTLSPVSVTVSVFASNYNYLSVVGVNSATVKDFALPLAPRKSPRTTGGMTGRVDYDTYARFRGSNDFRASIVAPSFPVKSFLNFDLSLFLGELPDADCGVSPTPAGCYSVDTPFTEESLLPLPGGLTIGLGDSDVKGFFDSVGLPGSRYAWALGADIKWDDIGDLITIATPFLQDCSCDVDLDVCDAGCSCDTGCPGSVDVGQIFNAIVPLLPSFASGATGNLPLDEEPLTVWNDYIADDYGTGRVDNASFPVLDSGNGRYGKLVLREFLRKFTDYQVPTLPDDPNNDGKMEGMLVLTGVDATGYGFVPLGLGAALDCDGGDCLDSNNPSLDGVVTGSQVCFASTKAEDDKCDDLPGLPSDGFLNAGHMGVFHAPAHSGLEGQNWVTLAVALPLSELLDDGGLRATGVVLREEPAEGADVIPNEFPAFPAMDSTITSRTYLAPAGNLMQWVTFASADDGNGVSTRWNVYFPNAGGAFAAPSVPNGFTDPFEGNVDGELDTTHVAFATGGVTLDSLVAATDGKTITDLQNFVEGLSVQNRLVPVN